MNLAFPTPTRYDRIARYLLQKAKGSLCYWSLKLTPEKLGCDAWLNSQLTVPGFPQRICDGLIPLFDLEKGGVPFLGILEVETAADPLMPGKILLAGALAWLTMKPTPHPGDRYALVGLVYNLTGIGHCAQSYSLSDTEWTLFPKEINFCQLDAGVILDEIATGKAPAEFMAFIPLMQNAAEDAIITRWRAMAVAETNPQRRADYALARVFAERVELLNKWQPVCEDLLMVESPIIAGLLSEAEAKAEAKAEARAQAKSLLCVMRKRYGEIPEAVTAAIRACKDGVKLDGWLDVSLDAATFAQFRQMTGL